MVDSEIEDTSWEGGIERDSVLCWGEDIEISRTKYGNKYIAIYRCHTVVSSRCWDVSKRGIVELGKYSTIWSVEYLFCSIDEVHSIEFIESNI